MVGFTGVVWFPRGATVNSAALYAGPGPVPLTAASAAWSDLAGVLGAGAAALTAVVAELGATWRGPAADVAYASFAAYGAWLAETTEHAARMAVTTGAGAAAYTASALVMPSLAEIAATRAATAAVTVAAAPTGAGLGAAAAAAEAAEREMDIRAAMAMDGYEAASTVLSVPEPFRPAPQLTVPRRQALSSAEAMVREASTVVDGAREHVHAAVAQSPGAQPGAPPAGGGAASAVTRAASAAVPTPHAGASVPVAASGTGGPVPQAGPASAVVPSGAGGAVAGRAGVTPGAPAVSGPRPSVVGGPPRSARLPAVVRGDTAGAVSPVSGGGATGARGEPPRAGGLPVRGAVPPGMRSAPGGAVGDEHEPDERLRSLDRVDDGRLVVPAVLGDRR